MGNECSLVDGCSQEELIYLIPSLFYISTPNNICSHGFFTKRDYSTQVMFDRLQLLSIMFHPVH